MGINKKITWWEPEFGEEEAKAVYDVVKSGYVNEGKHSEELSNKIKNLLNVNYAVTAPNGTISLFLALKGVGVGVGDEVIIVGASSFIGFHLFQRLKKIYNCVGTYFTNKRSEELIHLNILSKDELNLFFSTHKPDIVIWIAGSKDLKLCEQDENMHIQLTLNQLLIMLKCYTNKNLFYFN